MSLGENAESPAHRTSLVAYDVEVLIEADDPKIFEQVKTICTEALVGRVKFESPRPDQTGFAYRFISEPDGTVRYDLDGLVTGSLSDTIGSARHLNSMIRAHIGGRTKKWVFVHAGVVEWKGKAIVIPGKSRQGKTTLVSELIRLGAGYMSDEFAILDQDGLVHPFDRDLAVRRETWGSPESVSPSEFGGIRATVPIHAGMLIFTEFQEGGVWKPRKVSIGNGILAAIPQVIPFSFNTEFALKVLNTTFNRAIIVESDRGEAREAAPKILEFFEESLLSGESASN